MKKKLSIFLIAVITLSNSLTAKALSIPQPAKEEAASITLEAQSAILMDAATGEILYEKNIHEKHYPASITKLMTVLLALEHGGFDQTITFSHDAVFSIERNSSHIAIDAGEEITMEQALYAIMLQSANEVSNGVGEHISGSMELFAEKMTARAKELGCEGTNFVNANGLHNENHYTTAYDMALIGKEVLKYDFFKTLMSTTYYEIPPTNKQPEIRYLYGQNQLIKPSSIFYYEKCEGGKTGFTNEAGNTLVSFANEGETQLVAVVLKSTGYGAYTDTKALFDYGFNNFETKKIASKGYSPIDAQVLQTDKRKTVNLGTINAVYDDDIIVTLQKNTNLSLIKPDFTVKESYESPIRKGELLSDVKFTLNNSIIATGKLVSDTTILSPAKTEKDKEIKPINILLVSSILLSSLFIITIIRFVINKINYEKRRKRRKLRMQKYQQIYKNSPSRK